MVRSCCAFFLAIVVSVASTLAHASENCTVRRNGGQRCGEEVTGLLQTKYGLPQQGTYAQSTGPDPSNVYVSVADNLLKDLEKIKLPPTGSLADYYEMDDSSLDGLARAALSTFSFMMTESGYAAELTDKEAELFRHRFVSFFAALMNHSDVAYMSEVRKTEEWVEHALLSFRMMRPVMSQAEVNRVNSKGLGWIAKLEAWMQHVSVHSFDEKLGRVMPEGHIEWLQKNEREYLMAGKSAINLPQTFDSRDRWPECKSEIGRVLNQGQCGSCWAFASMSTVDSRLCIATNGTWSGTNALLSRGYVSSCAIAGWDGCRGGLARYTYELVATGGVPTGGEAGCSPYFGIGEGTEHFQQTRAAPPCPTSCHAGYSRPLAHDLFTMPDISKFEEFWSSSVESILRAKRLLYDYGPLSFGFYASYVFMSYQSGIFEHPTCDTRPNHEVLAIGWGADPKPHIIARNSWGKDWGEDGGFRVADCGATDFTNPGSILVESSILPKLPTKARVV